MDIAKSMNHFTSQDTPIRLNGVSKANSGVISQGRSPISDHGRYLSAETDSTLDKVILAGEKEETSLDTPLPFGTNGPIHTSQDAFCDEVTEQPLVPEESLDRTRDTVIDTQEQLIFEERENVEVEKVESVTSYAQPELGTPASIPSDGKTLSRLDTTIATPSFSAVDANDLHRAPEPPRLKPLPSPGLPLVSPLLDRKGRASASFDGFYAAWPNFEASGDVDNVNKSRVLPDISEETLISTGVRQKGDSPDARDSVTNLPSISQIPYAERSQDSEEHTTSEVTQKNIRKKISKDRTIDPMQSVGSSPPVPSGQENDGTHYEFDGSTISQPLSLPNDHPNLDDQWGHVRAAHEEHHSEEVEEEKALAQPEMLDTLETDFQAAKGFNNASPIEELGQGVPLDLPKEHTDQFHSDPPMDQTGSDEDNLTRDIEAALFEEEDTDTSSEYSSEEENQERAEDEVSFETSAQRQVDVIVLDSDADEYVTENNAEDYIQDEEGLASVSPDDGLLELERASRREGSQLKEDSPTLQLLEELSETRSPFIAERANIETLILPTAQIQMIHGPLPQSSPQPAGLLKFADDDIQLENQVVGPVTKGTEREVHTSLPAAGPSDIHDSIGDRRLASRPMTPGATQQSGVLSESSQISLQSFEDNHHLPTPQLTQSISEEVLSISPDRQRRVSLIERLKDLRTASAAKSIEYLNDPASKAINPWFTTKRSSQIPVESESEIESADESDGSSVNHENHAEQKYIEPSPPMVAETSIKPADLSVPSSDIETVSVPPRTGFRTRLSYFAPLSTLAEHFNSTTDILAIVISHTVPTRAKSGPRDIHQAIYLTDPSSASSTPKSPLSTAQIFRPHKDALPTLHRADALLLRNFKVQSQRHKPMLLSTASSAWAVFRKGEDVQIRGPHVEIGAEEKEFAEGLGEWWSTLSEEVRDGILAAVPKARGKAKGKAKGKRASMWVNRHELRDGTTYTDEPVEERNAVHELRDGTTYKDEVV